MRCEPNSLFADFLTALQDPGAGEHLYQLHAPESIVRCSEGLGRAADTDSAAFALCHRKISLQWAGSLPEFTQPDLVKASATGSTEELVCWFAITEVRDQQETFAAVGIRTGSAQPLIGWATLGPKVQNWSYRDGYLQSLADYPWMQLAAPARARTLLDASYFRQYFRAPVAFSMLPHARFACQMSTVCCKHDFEIALPPAAQLLIDAMPWPSLQPNLEGTRLTQRPDGMLQLKSLDESCRFLGPLGQCLIHQTLGRQPFGPCCIFPVAFAQTPEGIAVALSPICDGARHGVGPELTEREPDLRERLVHAQPRRSDGFRLAPGAEVPWDNFRDVEKALCEILATQDLPMRRRLYLGTRLLGVLRDNEQVQIHRWLTEPMVDITAELRHAIHGMLRRILAWDRSVLRALPPAPPANLFDLEARDPEVLGRLLQNTLFSKTYSYPYDLTSAHNFLVVLYLITLVMQEATLEQRLSERMWRELGSLGVHGLLKSVLHEGVPEGFREVFGTAEFGMWMLSA
jgi:hypothetical protein